VHRSNFALVGFTEDTSVEELARLCQPRGLPLFVDAGSGLLEPLSGEGLGTEPTMRAHLEAGADLVAFSGDKLLGGPQAGGGVGREAGVVVGRTAWVARLRAHPLARALRIDKLTVAALEATLQLYLDGRRERIPALAMVEASEAVLREHAGVLQRLLAELGTA